MGTDFFGENRDSTAKHRAKKFFDMLSERRRKERVDQQELRKQQQTLREAQRKQYQAIKSSLREIREARVRPQPSPPEPPHQQEPVKPVSVDPVTQEFLRWVFNRDKEEDDTPYWVKRSPRLYGKGSK